MICCVNLHLLIAGGKGLFMFLDKAIIRFYLVCEISAWDWKTLFFIFPQHTTNSILVLYLGKKTATSVAFTDVRILLE